MNRYDAIVIGAGANGLAAAALLARRLRRVLVLERRDVAGGTNATEEIAPGYRVGSCRDDLGWLPTVLVRQLELGRHGLRTIPATAGLVGLAADAPLVATYPETDRTIDSLRSVSSGDAARWGAFCAFTAGVTSLLEAAYSARPPRIQSRAIGELLAMAGLGRRLRALGRRGMMEALRVLPMPVSDLAEEWFEGEGLRAMLAVQGTTGVMHGPLSGGTALVFLHRQVGQPAGCIGLRLLARGGNAALVEALASAARAAGVEIRLAAEVSQVLVRDGRATGVVLATGEEITSEHVVSSADPQRSMAWVDPRWLDPAFLHAVDNVRTRGATARVHYALDGLPRFHSGGREVPRDALGGTMTIAASVSAVEQAYDEAKYGMVPASPAVTMSLPTLLDASLAPERRHVLSVTVHHVPFSPPGGWGAAAGEMLAERVTAIVSSVVSDLRERTVARRVVTPADLESVYGCTGGSLTHGELALDQFGFMRPVPSCARYATPIPGFWLGGTGSHPANASGGAGRLAARELLASR